MQIRVPPLVGGGPVPGPNPPLNSVVHGNTLVLVSLSENLLRLCCCSLFPLDYAVAPRDVVHGGNVAGRALIDP